MSDAILGVEGDERVVRQPRVGDRCDDVRERGIRVGLSRADLGYEEPERFGGHGGDGALVAPTVPAPHGHLL